MKKKRLIIAVVIICCVILYIWQTNKIHNSPKTDTAVSTESNTTTQQAETTTQLTTQTSTETTMESNTEEYFEEEGYILDGEKISMEEGDNYIENIREEYQSLRGEM